METKPDQSLFLRGLIDTLPLIFAATPFAILYGALAINYGLSFAAAIGMSVFVYAGASQFVAATLVGAGTPILIIIATVFIVNLRHMLYSVALMPRVKSLHKGLRFFMAFWMTDESFAAVSRYLQRKPTDQEFHRYFWGSAFGMYTNWIFFTWIGVVLGQTIPDMTTWGLDMAMVLAFIAIVVPSLKHHAHIACALTAGVAAILTYDWPFKTGLLISSILAIVVGFTLDKQDQQETA